MHEFPSNSQNVVPPSTPKKKERQKVERVVTGEVIQRQKPLGRKFKDIFFGGEFKGATRYVLSDVLLPAVRNMVVDATTKGIERVIYGESTNRRPTIFGSGPRIQYNRPIDRGYSGRPAMLPDQPPLMRARGQSGRHESTDIILASREEADVVLERMGDILEKYGAASVADLHDLVGLPTTHVDNKWGWTSLSTAMIRQIRDGYHVDLPQPEPIE